MEKQNSIVSVVATAVVALVAVYSIVSLAQHLSSDQSVKPNESLGTDITKNTSIDSYTDGSDLYQNVQAMAERMEGVSQYQILQADSQGRMQAVAPGSLAGTAWDFDALRAMSLVQTGSVVDFTASSTVTAAQLCDSGAFTFTATAGIPTITLPATTTLFADCLTTNGDSISIPVVNASSATTTLMAAGTGGTLLVSSSSTVGVSDGALLKVVRDAATTYKAMLFNAL